jgi:Lon-like ATP-dependent protease
VLIEEKLHLIHFIFWGAKENRILSACCRFQERWEPRKALAPEEACRVVDEEMGKLGGLEPSSPEFNVTRNYLEWLTALPWGQHSQEIFDVGHAKQVSS